MGNLNGQSEWTILGPCSPTWFILAHSALGRVQTLLNPLDWLRVIQFLHGLACLVCFLPVPRSLLLSHTHYLGLSQPDCETLLLVLTLAITAILDVSGLFHLIRTSRMGMPLRILATSVQLLGHECHRLPASEESLARSCPAQIGVAQRQFLHTPLPNEKAC